MIESIKLILLYMIILVYLFVLLIAYFVKKRRAKNKHESEKADEQLWKDISKLSQDNIINIIKELAFSRARQMEKDIKRINEQFYVLHLLEYIKMLCKKTGLKYSQEYWEKYILEEINV